MKKIIRLTESDLACIIKRVIKEQEENDSLYTDSREDFQFDIRAVDCDPSQEYTDGTVDIDEDEDGNDIIVIRYCRGDKKSLRKLTEKGKKLMYGKYGYDINESEEEDSEVTPEMIINMLMREAESTPQENYDDPYDWMQDVFSPVENKLEDMGFDISDLRMEYDDILLSMWERDDDDWDDED